MVEDRHARTGEALEAVKDRQRSPNRPLDVERRDGTTQESAFGSQGAVRPKMICAATRTEQQAGVRAGIGGGIGSIGKPEQHDEKREGAIAQDGQNLLDRQPLARLRRQRSQNLGCA